MRVHILGRRAYAGKRGDHEARRRLIPISARSQNPTILCSAADAPGNLYLLRGECEQAIATLNDLARHAEGPGLPYWIDQRLKQVAGD